MTTSTQALEHGLVAAPIAAIDRRSLSQAWYSALGLSQQGNPRTAVARRATAQMPAPAVRRSPDAQRTTLSNAPAARATVSSTAPARSSSRAATEPLPFSRSIPLAKRIERTLERRPLPKRATLVLDGNGGRVHVLIQRCGSRLRIVTVCRRAVRDVVARALSEVSPSCM